MPAHSLRTALTALAAIALASAAHAQGPAPGPQAPAPAVMDDTTRAAVVGKAAEALRSRYIFPDTGETAAAKIEAQLAAGAYKEITQPHAFADKLTTDLQSVTKDKHMRVNVQGAGPAPPPTGAAPSGPPPKSESGVVRADRLAGDIGYIEISGFPPPGAFRPAIDKAMTSLKDSKALIVDVRRNGGGSPDSVAYLVSFFVDGTKPMVLNDFFNRKPGTKEFTTRQTLTSKTPVSFTGKKVYVLTSPRTFSGGEEFSYDMQSFKLATLVGETTGGGANPGGVMPIGFSFGIFMPDGRPVNPVTKTNWEGVGVIPEIRTPVEDALKVALEKLGQKPAAKDIDTLSQANLFEPRKTPLPGTEAALRRTIAELASGQPNYELMTPNLQKATREQLPMLKDTFSSLGALKSVAFREPGPQGDTYDLTFEKGAVIFTISLDAAGKTAGSLFRRAPPPAQ